jgi:hypothetical protein
MTDLLDRPDLTVDFELMFGEMPETPCESSQHGVHESHDDGPAKHYWKMEHECWMPKGQIYAVCERKTADLNRAMYYTLTNCLMCGGLMRTENFVSYVGPVGK